MWDVRPMDKELAEFLLPHLRKRSPVYNRMKCMKKLTAREYLKAAGIALRATFTDKENALLDNDEECYLHGRCFSVPGKTGKRFPLEAPDHAADPSLTLLYLDRDSPEAFKKNWDYICPFHDWEIIFGHAEFRPLLLQYGCDITDEEREAANNCEPGLNFRYDRINDLKLIDFDEWIFHLSTHSGTMRWRTEDIHLIGRMYAALLKAGYPVDLSNEDEKKILSREVRDIISGKVDRVREAQEAEEQLRKMREEFGSRLFDLLSAMPDEDGEWSSDDEPGPDSEDTDDETDK